MKNHTSKKINAKKAKNALPIFKKIGHNDKLYGTAVIGGRGQIVIPATARKELEIKPGDQLVFIGNKIGKVLTLMKSDNLAELMKMILSHMEGTGMEEYIKEHFEKLIKSLPKNQS